MALLYRSLPVSSRSQGPRQSFHLRRTPSRTLAVRAVAREGENWALGRGCGLLATATAMTIALPLTFEVAVPLPAQAVQPVSGIRSTQAFPSTRSPTRSPEPGWASSVRVPLLFAAQLTETGAVGLATWFETLPRWVCQRCPLHHPASTHSAPLLTCSHTIRLLQTITEIEESAARCTTGACKDVRLAHSYVTPFAAVVVGHFKT